MSNMNLDVFKLLYNSWPEAIRIPGSNGNFPLHELCLRESEITDELAILMFMLDIDQTVVRERRNDEGELPIHLALGCRSTGFCRVLIDAYPQSLRVGTNYGSLPIHEACRAGEVDTILYNARTLSRKSM